MLLTRLGDNDDDNGNYFRILSTAVGRSKHIYCRVICCFLFCFVLFGVGSCLFYVTDITMLCFILIHFFVYIGVVT